ncbi:RNase H domain-containing protein [Trichonephila clavipes]|nr:RNase H domain-containing protein [Trichonephila clavipes]
MRRTDVKLTRLRIGHTRFTHRHLLFGERAPECPSCHVSYTVHHILIDCPVFNNYRITFFNSSHLTLPDLGLKKFFKEFFYDCYKNRSPQDPEPPADPQIEALVRQLELENEDATLSFETRPRYPAGFAKRNVIVTNFFSN